MITVLIASLVSLVSLAMLGGQSEPEPCIGQPVHFVPYATDFETGEIVYPVMPGDHVMIHAHITWACDVDSFSGSITWAQQHGLWWNAIEGGTMSAGQDLIVSQETIIESWMFGSVYAPGSQTTITITLQMQTSNGSTTSSTTSNYGLCARNPDINGDGVVNLIDLMLVLEASGQTGTHIIEDLTCDNVVDIADLLILLEHWTE